MKNPRKRSNVATPESVPEYTPEDIGEPPGSPTYFGESDAAGNTNTEISAEEEQMPAAGPGLPPGSAEYWGVDAMTHTAARAPDDTELPLPTVGEPPGSSEYFGMSGGVK